MTNNSSIWKLQCYIGTFLLRHSRFIARECPKLIAKWITVLFAIGMYSTHSLAMILAEINICLVVGMWLYACVKNWLRVDIAFEMQQYDVHFPQRSLNCLIKREWFRCGLLFSRCKPNSICRKYVRILNVFINEFSNQFIALFMAQAAEKLRNFV